jgi:hypothetical protein
MNDPTNRPASRARSRPATGLPSTAGGAAGRAAACDVKIAYGANVRKPVPMTAYL